MSTTNSAQGEVVGIIGAGRLGQAMAQTVLRAGRSVVVCNSRAPETLAPVVARLGSRASAGTPREASQAGIVALCVPWDNILDAVRGLEWSGQVLIDATNDLDPVGLCGRRSSEVVAGLTPGARLVKAANTLEAAVLAADPREAGGHRVIFISGDNGEAKRAVAGLFGDAGFFIIDLGGLATGSSVQEIGGPLPSHNLIHIGSPELGGSQAAAIPASSAAYMGSLVAEYWGRYRMAVGRKRPPRTSIRRRLDCRRRPRR
jgi:8-hydroxy-5-deazaflavin:NADPH oxidoreductase